MRDTERQREGAEESGVCVCVCVCVWSAHESERAGAEVSGGSPQRWRWRRDGGVSMFTPHWAGGRASRRPGAWGRQ